MGALSTWTAWVTMIGVGLALYVIVWPRVGMWATRYSVFKINKTLDLLDPMPNATWYQKAIRGLKLTIVNVRSLFVPLRYRLALYRLAQIVGQEMEDATDDNYYDPTPGCHPTVAEITAYVFYKMKRNRERQLMRIHKNVRCASPECNVKYGRKRKDHGFPTGEGVRNSGGWYCETDDPNGRREYCFPTATGNHYCGMCLRERQAADNGTETLVAYDGGFMGTMTDRELG